MSHEPAALPDPRTTLRPAEGFPPPLGTGRHADRHFPRVAVCPVCRARRLHYLFSVQAHRIVRCDDCGLLLTNPQPSDDELAGIYHENYFLADGDEAGRQHTAALKQRTADHYLDLLARYRGETGGRLLEVGCGQGDFLSRAAARGWLVTGVDRSAPACAEARARLRGTAGAEVVWGEVTDLPAEERYDACVLADVLANVRDPRSLLEQVYRRLRLGGTVFVAA